MNSILATDPNHQKSIKCKEIASRISGKKEEGNCLFKEGKFDEALKVYTYSVAGGGNILGFWGRILGPAPETRKKLDFSLN